MKPDRSESQTLSLPNIKTVTENKLALHLLQHYSSTSILNIILQLLLTNIGAYRSKQLHFYSAPLSIFNNRVWLYVCAFAPSW